jgi:hypothetical protein
MFSSAAPDAASSLEIIRAVTRQLRSSFYTCTDVVAILAPVRLLLQDASRRVALAATDDFQAMYGALVVKVAESYINVREDADARGRTHNTGAEVEQMQRNVGISAGDPWCAAFVYTCHSGAAQMLASAAHRLSTRTTCPRTGSAAALWYQSRSSNTRFTHAQVLAGTWEPRAGDLFVNERITGGRVGTNLARDTGEFFPSHTGIVRGYEPQQQRLVTIEGNTNDDGSRDGIGVFERNDRMQQANLYGFVRPKVLFA